LCGYDEISTQILEISSPLNYICNKVLVTGFLLSHLKYSKIKPLYKKGDKNNKVNCRPISILPSFSKVFEKVTNIRLLEHINNNKILVKEKFGSRSKCTAEMASYSPISGILNTLNNKNIIGSIFCDLTKAFDCLNPLNTELNPTCHLLVLLGAHPILHISRIRVNHGILLQTLFRR